MRAEIHRDDDETRDKDGTRHVPFEHLPIHIKFEILHRHMLSTSRRLDFLTGTVLAMITLESIMLAVIGWLLWRTQ